MTWQQRPDGTQTCDVRGASLDRVVELVEQAVDDAIERSLDDQEIVLHDLGVTDAECAALLADVHRESLARKRAFLAHVRRRLVD